MILKKKILSKIGKAVIFQYPSKEGNEHGVLKDRFLLRGGGRSGVPYWDVVDLIEFPNTEESEWLRFGYYRMARNRLVWGSQTTITEPMAIWKKLLIGAAKAKPWFEKLILEVADELRK